MKRALVMLLTVGAGACIDFDAAQLQYCEVNPQACGSSDGGDDDAGVDAGAEGGGAAGGGAAGGGSAGGGAAGGGSAGGGSAGGGSAGGGSEGGGSAGGGSIPMSCLDGSKQPSETDVDCGGSVCPRCDVDKLCSVAADCQTASCQNGRCALVSGGVDGEPTPRWQFVGGFDLGGQATITSGRSNFALARQGPTFYLAGGTITQLGGAMSERATEQLLTFQAPANAHPAPTTGASVFNAAMGSQRQGPMGGIYNGNLWIIGGAGGLGPPIPSVESYALVGDMWTSRASIANTQAIATSLQLPDGGLFVFKSGDLVKRFNFADAGFLDAGVRTAGQVDAPAVMPDGTIYFFAYDGMRSVARWPAGGASVTVVSTAPSVRGNGLRAVYAPDGRFYLVGGANQTVEAFSPRGDFAAVSPTIEGHSAGGLGLGEDGRVYAFLGRSTAANNQVGYSRRIEAYGPTLDVSPSAGGRGLGARVTGNNFAANAEVKLFWGPIDGGQLVTTITSSSDGGFGNVLFTIPATGAGPIWGIDSRARYPVHIPFTLQ